MSLFVPVNEPAEIRRELLTSSKQVLGALRRYEHYRQLRKAKLEAFHELVTIWQDMERMQRKLRGALPKTDVKAPPIPKTAPLHHIPAKVAPMGTRAQPPQKPVREQKSKLQLLEEQLNKIENKLSTIK